MLKKLLAAGAVAIGLTGLAAPASVAARTLDEIIKSGTIRVGVNPTLPPLGKFDDKNEIVGFDVDFATVLGVLTTKDKSFTDWKQFNEPSVTFVQVRGSTPVKFIEDNLKNAKVTLLDNYPDAVRALAQGRGTAMIDVIDFMGEHMAKHKVEWKVVETPIDIYYCGLGISKTSTGLKDWLNVAIFELHRRGKTDEIWKKWFGMDMLKPVGVTPYF
jgi:polar amino acid transport system substrate-binding protein